MYDKYLHVFNINSLYIDTLFCGPCVILLYCNYTPKCLS